MQCQFFFHRHIESSDVIDNEWTVIVSADECERILSLEVEGEYFFACVILYRILYSYVLKFIWSDFVCVGAVTIEVFLFSGKLDLFQDAVVVRSRSWRGGEWCGRDLIVRLVPS
jgi:hypothetical protein